MADRIAIPKRIRFEVFKRDSFTRQYCGKKAPEVILHIDHIQPVSLGGTNEMMNLVTSCEACNLGKSNIPLDDNSAVQKQRRQLELEQETQEQKEMLFEWYKSLQNATEDSISKLKDYWEFLGKAQYQINDSGIAQIRELKNSSTDEEIIDAMNTAAKQYFVYESEKITMESYSLAFSKLGGIIKGKKYDKAHPEVSKLFYIRGILRNKIQYYYDDKKALEILKEAFNAGLSIEELTEIAKRAHNWSGWRADIYQSLEEKNK